MNHRSSFCAIALLFVFGCSDGDPDSSNTDEGDLLPWAEGNTWTYKVTDDAGVVTEKVTTVLPLEKVGGVGPHSQLDANKVVTKKSGGSDETHSWQAADGEKHVRYREISFDKAGAPDLEEHWSPFKLRVDGSRERLNDADGWIETYQETKVRKGVADPAQERKDLWQVIKPSEPVEVPAGKFDAVVVQRTSGSDNVKQYWFVRGVGKVKETGGQTEELQSFSVR